MTQKPTFFLVRHGNTDMNDASVEVIRSWSNPQLNADGIEAAETVGKYLGLEKVVCLVAGDLDRTRHTAKIIQKYTGAPLKITSELRPWHLGKLTGQPVKDILDQMLYFESNPDEIIPEGESFNQFLNRWRGIFESTAKATEAHPTEGHIVLVGHSRHMLTLPRILRPNLPPPPFDGGPPPGSLLQITKGEKSWKPQLVNLKEGEFSGRGPFRPGKNHLVGMRVPYGGSCCANCEYLGKDLASCTNLGYARWKDGKAKTPTELPAPAMEYCCDFYSPGPDMEAYF